MMRNLVTGFAFVSAVAIAVLVAEAAETTRRKLPPRPNILLIMADDVGREVLGCYGGTAYKTPNIDKLAKSGMKFRHCYCMPVCHPTRVCLLSGKYPFQLGNPRWGSYPKTAEKQTFAHVLKDAGYATAVAGKWQLSLLSRDLNQPHRMGFDEYSLFGWHEGPRYFQPLIFENGKVRDDVKERYGPDVYVKFLADFMKRNQEKPFLAYYPMAVCHDVTDDLDEPVPVGPHDRYESYTEMVTSMDAHVGQIIDALDDLNLREKTLILFTTDNGTPKSYIADAVNGKLVHKAFTTKFDGKELRGGKSDLTDLGTRVPLIASWKGVISAGTVSDVLVDFSDILPTLADLGNAKLPDAKIEGKTFTSAFLGRSGSNRNWVFAEHGKRSYLRSRHWKLYNDGKFFDMRNDPYEKKPVSVSDQTAAAAKARGMLQSEFKRLLSRTR